MFRFGDIQRESEGLSCLNFKSSALLYAPMTLATAALQLRRAMIVRGECHHQSLA
jgi:hypothetical protein